MPLSNECDTEQPYLLVDDLRVPNKFQDESAIGFCTGNELGFRFGVRLFLAIAARLEHGNQDFLGEDISHAEYLVISGQIRLAIGVARMQVHLGAPRRAGS